jgi:hypothetical protein
VRRCRLGRFAQRTTLSVAGIGLTNPALLAAANNCAAGRRRNVLPPLVADLSAPTAAEAQIPQRHVKTRDAAVDRLLTAQATPSISRTSVLGDSAEVDDDLASRPCRRRRSVARQQFDDNVSYDKVQSRHFFPLETIMSGGTTSTFHQRPCPPMAFYQSKMASPRTSPPVWCECFGASSA